jgi:molybdate transport repressor ModE-like protein
MRDISLTLIQTFFVVAREGSFSAGARTLNMSNQSAANHVRRLEQIFGERLLRSERGAQSVTLTARGRSVYRLLKPELDVMLTRLGHIVDTQRPVLRIGLPQAVFYYLLPPVLAALRTEYPDIEVIAYERDTALAELVKEGNLDVCISERYFGDQAVPQYLISSYRLCLICPRTWTEQPAAGDVLEWAKGRPFITYEQGQLLRNTAIDYLSRGGADPVIAVSTSGSSSVKRCVRAGLGYAIIPAWCVAVDDPTLYSIVLENVPEIPLYFGESDFLRANPCVVTLRRLSAELMVPRIQFDNRFHL